MTVLVRHEDGSLSALELARIKVVSWSQYSNRFDIELEDIVGNVGSICSAFDNIKSANNLVMDVLLGSVQDLSGLGVFCYKNEDEETEYTEDSEELYPDDDSDDLVENSNDSIHMPENRWSCNSPEVQSKKGKHSLRRWIAFGCAVVVLLVILLVPVWDVKIKGSSEPYDVWVWVNDTPTRSSFEVVDFAILDSPVVESSAVVGDSFLNSFTDNGAEVVTQYIPVFANEYSSNCKFYWDVLNTRMQNTLDANVPVLLYCNTSGSLNISSMYYYPGIMVYGTLNDYAIFNEGSQTVYNGLHVYLSSMWLNETQSLGKILWCYLFGTGYSAEGIESICLFEHGF